MIRNRGVVDRIHEGVFSPDGIFIDSHGTLYVTNGHMSGNNSVEAYQKGSHKPFRVYTGAFCAFDVVAAADGTVYIADACGGRNTRGRVLVYPPGKTKPSRSIYPGGAPYCVTLDSANNLYVGYNANYSYAGQVKRYHPGAAHGTTLLPPSTAIFITGIAIDKRGALLVANSGDGVIDVFTRKDQPPARVIKTGQQYPFMFSFDRNENRLYVSYPCTSGGVKPASSSSGCGSGANTVVALDYSSGKPIWSLSLPHWVPKGVAVTPTAPF